MVIAHEVVKSKFSLPYEERRKNQEQRAADRQQKACGDQYEAPFPERKEALMGHGCRMKNGHGLSRLMHDNLDTPVSGLGDSVGAWYKRVTLAVGRDFQNILTYPIVNQYITNRLSAAAGQLVVKLNRAHCVSVAAHTDADRRAPFNGSKDIRNNGL